MKYCKQCDCHLPDDYDLDFCPPCLEDTDGVIPDCYRDFEEVKHETGIRVSRRNKS